MKGLHGTLNLIKFKYIFKIKYNFDKQAYIIKEHEKERKRKKVGMVISACTSVLRVKFFSLFLCLVDKALFTLL